MFEKVRCNNDWEKWIQPIEERKLLGLYQKGWKKEVDLQDQSA